MDGGEIRTHRDPQRLEFAADFIAAFGFFQPDHVNEPAVPGGCGGGVGQFDPETGRIDMLRDRHPELDSFKLVRDILQMKDGDLVGVGDNGRFRYDPASDVVRKNASEEAFTQTNQLERDPDGWY